MESMTRFRDTHRQSTVDDLEGLRAEGYVRDSTLDQRDGFGPDIQRRNIQRCAESHGLQLGTRWYTEFVSGLGVAKRTEFRQFVEDARLGHYDVLLVDHTSRFGRNQADCIRYKEELQRSGIVIVFTSQGIISGSDRDFLAERINETLDEAYSRNLSRYVREGKARKAEAGYALGHAPLGYRQEKAKSGRGAWAVPDERTMPALLALLAGYASGLHSMKSLALELNSKGYTSTRGNPFTEGSIVTVLNNPFYSGRFYFHRGRPDEELKNGVHEVSPEMKAMWIACQDTRTQKAHVTQPSPRSKGHRVYPLTGILVCDNCGKPYHGVSTISKPRSYPRMFHSRHRCGMKPLSVAAPLVERAFSERVISCLRLDEGCKTAVLLALANEGPTPDHSLEMKHIELAQANLRKQHLWGAVTDETFKAEYKALARQLAALQTPVTTAWTPDLDRAAHLLRDMAALWEHPGITDEERRELAREVFQELRLRDGQIVAVTPRPEYAPLFAHSVLSQNVVGGPRSS